MPLSLVQARTIELSFTGSVLTKSVGEEPEVQEEEQSETSFQDTALTERKTPRTVQQK